MVMVQGFVTPNYNYRSSLQATTCWEVFHEKDEGLVWHDERTAGPERRGSNNGVGHAISTAFSGNVYQGTVERMVDPKFF